MDPHGVVDLRFRTALARMESAGRILCVPRDVSPEYELAAVLKRHDGGPALLFPTVSGYSTPVIGNLLASSRNCEAAFGTDFRGIRRLVTRALGDTAIPPTVVASGPARDVVHRADIEIDRLLPALRHAPGDAGRFITAGIVIARHPHTGVYNASYHRLQLLDGDRLAIRLDLGRHLRSAFEAAAADGQDLPISIAVGTDLSLMYTAATMGSQMPEDKDELSAAGALQGSPLEVLEGLTQDVLAPAHAEFVLEGYISHSETVHEGPFGEFMGYHSDSGPAPVVHVTALTHRCDPLYFAINGAGRETVMLRKYVLEASALEVLGVSAPTVVDVDITEGGLHRFHLNIAVRKEKPEHDGMERNAALAAFGALKDLVRVVLVDDDIDVHSESDVEYAIATRCDAAVDVVVVPGARGHEYVRVSRGGIGTKWFIDATVPFAAQHRFMRIPFQETGIEIDDMRPSEFFAPGLKEPQ
jgi:2,5-furandicarboxylate decarboxylase 1